jgi:hypothetical protein
MLEDGDDKKFSSSERMERREKESVRKNNMEKFCTMNLIIKIHLNAMEQLCLHIAR